jgi:hypothetical protein
MVHSPVLPLNLGDTTIAGLRLIISGTTNPAKSQITIVPGIGWNGRGIEFPGANHSLQNSLLTTEAFIMEIFVSGKISRK